MVVSLAPSTSMTESLEKFAPDDSRYRGKAGPSTDSLSSRASGKEAVVSSKLPGTNKAAPKP
jgi:hypothetical protein